MATKLSVIKKVTAASTLEQLKEKYFKNNLNYNLEKIFKKKEYTKIINFMANDKKNNDNKINLILLKKIGIPSKPGNYKFSFSEIRRIFEWTNYFLIFFLNIL